MDKVVVKSDPLMTEAYPEKVQTRMTLVEPSGELVTHLQEYPKGHCKNPLNKSEVEEKFKNLFGYFSAENDGQKLLDYIWNIDGENSLAIPF